MDIDAKIGGEQYGKPTTWQAIQKVKNNEGFYNILWFSMQYVGSEF